MFFPKLSQLILSFMILANLSISSECTAHKAASGFIYIIKWFLQRTCNRGICSLFFSIIFQIVQCFELKLILCVKILLENLTAHELWEKFWHYLLKKLFLPWPQCFHHFFIWIFVKFDQKHKDWTARGCFMLLYCYLLSAAFCHALTISHKHQLEAWLNICMAKKSLWESWL